MIRNDFTAEVVIQNGIPVVTNSTVGVKASTQRAKEFGINYVAIMIFTIIVAALLFFINRAMIMGF